MKVAFRLLLLVAMLGTSFTVQAQRGKKNAEKLEIPAFPMENGKVTYTSVENAKGTQAELYKKALSWFNAHYKNPKSVITKADADNFTITGRHRFPTYMTDPKTGAQTRGPLAMYSIEVMCKDGRYKYTVNKITQKAATALEVEQMVRDQRVKYQPARANHLLQMHEHCVAVVYDLKKAMAAGPAAKEADW